MTPSGGDKRCQPARFGKGVGIEQGNELGSAQCHGPVVGGSEAEILSGQVKLNPRCEAIVLLCQLSGGGDGAIVTRVVDYHDPCGQQLLGGQA